MRRPSSTTISSPGDCKGGGRQGEGAAYGNLGNAYRSQGDYAKAIEDHTQYLAIAKEVGDRGGEGAAYGNLGIDHMYLNERQVAHLSRGKEAGGPPPHALCLATQSRPAMLGVPAHLSRQPVTGDSIDRGNHVAREVRFCISFRCLFTPPLASDIHSIPTT
jgi:hypothetical protein